MHKRGTTLIELMITVAIIGISSGILIGAAHQARMAGFAEVQRERALLLLEYHAGCASSGQPASAEVTQRLVESLPDARVRSESADGLTTFTVQWRPPLGLTQERSLTVFTTAGSTP